MGKALQRALFRWTLAFAFLVSPAVEGSAAEPFQPPMPASILWIGNSFTLYNGGIPAAVQALAAALRPLPDVTLRMGTNAVGGAHLPRHAADMALSLNEGWDVVVMQGYSDEPIHPDKTAAFAEALDTLQGRIAAAGAATLLFMTWAYSDRPQMTAALAAAYEAAGQQINAPVVPVGLAFAAARNARPDLPLYVAEDNKHPSPAGTYLAGCTFFAALYGLSPEGAEIAPDRLPPGAARFLQKTAWQTVVRYYGWPPEGPSRRP